MSHVWTQWRTPDVVYNIARKCLTSFGYNRETSDVVYYANVLHMETMEKQIENGKEEEKNTGTKQD